MIPKEIKETNGLSESFDQARQYFENLSNSGGNERVVLSQNKELTENIGILSLAMNFLPKINRSLYMRIGSNKPSHATGSGNFNLEFDSDGEKNAKKLIKEYLMLKKGDSLKFNLSGIPKLLKQLDNSQKISEKIQYAIN